ncbi:MAG: tetratricopeptide repeat protein [Terriglobales bacterium]
MALRRIRFGQHTLAGIPVTQTAVLAFLVVALGACTLAQSRIWSSELELYGRGAEVAPRSPAIFEMARLMSQQKNFPAARNYLEQLIEVHPDDFRFLISASVMNICAFSIQVAGLRDYKRPIPFLLHATQVAPNESARGTADFYLGMAEMGAGQLPQAEESFRRAIQLAPRGPRMHYALGLLLQEEGRPQDAEQEFLAELQLNPMFNAREKLRELHAGSEAAPSAPSADPDIWNRIIGNAP